MEAGTPRVVGAESHVSEDGDACSVRAVVLHRFANAGAEACVYLAVLDYAPQR